MRRLRFLPRHMSLRLKAFLLLSAVFVFAFAVWVLVIDTLVDNFFDRQRTALWEEDQRQFGRVVQRQREAMELLALLATLDRRPFEDENRWLALMTDYQVLWLGRFDHAGRREGEISLWTDDEARLLRPAVATLLQQAATGRLMCVNQRCYYLLRFDERCNNEVCSVVVVQDAAVLLSEFYLLTGRNIVMLPRQAGMAPVGTHLAHHARVVRQLRQQTHDAAAAYLLSDSKGRTFLVTLLNPPPEWGAVQLFALHDITDTVKLFDRLRQHASLIGLVMWVLAVLVLMLGATRLLAQIQHLSAGLRSLSRQAYDEARAMLAGTPSSLIKDELDDLVDSSRELVDELQRLHDELVRLAEFDPLTHLKNRRAFQRLLDQWIREGCRGSLILVDLNRFKQINDLFGHLAGDLTLQELARRMRQFAQHHDGIMLFRLGGDEFVIWVPEQWIDESMLRALSHALEGWFELPTGERVYIESSLGAVHLPFERASAQEVIMRVDSAMYRAKDSDSAVRWRLYDPAEDNQGERLREEHALVAWLRQALEHDAFRLVYQPIVRTRDGVLSHHEVLLRLDGPEGELISPARFIPLAERYGLSGRIDEWVLEQVLRKLAATPDTLALAVNFSAATIQRRDLATWVQARLRHHGIKPCRLILELTETAYVANLALVRESLAALRRQGIRIALDDFGEGYASFNYLTELPFDFVKIDGRYVRQLHEKATYRALIAGLTQIIHAWGSEVVAEFVDNEAVLAHLRSVGVDYAQGYLIGRPAPTLMPIQASQQCDKQESQA